MGRQIIARVTTHEEGAAYGFCNITRTIYVLCYQGDLRAGMTRNHPCTNYGYQDCSDCPGTVEYIDEIDELNVSERQQIIVEEDKLYYVNAETGARSDLYLMDQNLNTSPAKANNLELF